MCCTGNGCFRGHDSSTAYLRFLTLRKDMVIHRLSSAVPLPLPRNRHDYLHHLDMDQQLPTDCNHWLPSIRSIQLWHTLLFPSLHCFPVCLFFFCFFSCISCPLSQICCTPKRARKICCTYRVYIFLQ